MSGKQTDARQALAFFSGAHFSAATPTFSRENNEAGHEVLLVSGMPVFRSGTFRDSMGYESSWDAFHMDQMVANFSMLSSRRIMDNLPVRAGHPSPFTNPMNELIGHVVSLRTEALTNPTDGLEYTYLLADFSIGDPVAAQKIEQGLWVNRSAEIGMYETNDGMGFYPTLMGFAYVDIPAVEGLNFSKNSRFNKDFVVAYDDEIKEEVVSFEFSLKTGKTTDFAAVQAHIATIEGENETLTAANTELTTKNTELEGFQAETAKANRADFVQGLIDGNKLLSSQKDDVLAYVTSLSAEQYTAYQSIMAGAPVLPLLANHGASDSSAGTPDMNQATETDVELENAKRIYKRHLDSGMRADAIKQTGSYKLLVAKGEITA